MARPVYILCAQSVSVDQDTKLASAFHLIEKVSIQKTQTSDPSARPPAQFQFKVIAVWMKEESDEQHEFEHEIVLPLSSDGKEATLKTGTFSFEGGKLLHRFVATIIGLPFRGETGIVEITSRIRIVGKDNWVHQSYPILVESNQSPEALVHDSNRAAAGGV